MANGISWYQKLATSLVPGSSAFFAPPTVADPSKKDMKNAIAYVDPSRALAGWNVTPYNPSWLVTRKGLQIYDMMKRDEQVKAALKFKVDSVLAPGWEVVSPGDEDEDWEVTRFVRDALNLIKGGWNQVLVDTLGALAYGYACAERVYEERETGEWKGKLILNRVQPLKPHFIDFLTDEFGQLKGVKQQMVASMNDPLPPAKFIIYSYAAEFGNFYGTSDLEAAYRCWWTKDNAYKWLATTLERYGMAPLFAFYDPSVYQGGAVDELKKIVKNIQNSSLGIIPRGNKDALELWSQNLNKGSSELFLKALDAFDQHIARAILVPSLLGMSSDQGKTGSLARSGTHADSFMQVVAQLQNNLSDAVMNAQVIPQLCDLNFPNLQSYPLFKFMPYTDEQRLDILNTWASMVGGQIVNKIEDDEVHIRKVIGFPENENPEVIEATPPPQPGVGVDAEGKPIKMGPDGQPLKLGPDGRPWKSPLKPGEKKPPFGGKLNPFAKKKFDQADYHLPGRHDQQTHGGARVAFSDLKGEGPEFIAALKSMLVDDGKTSTEAEETIETDVSLFLDGSLAEEYPKDAARIERLLTRRAAAASRRVKENDLSEEMRTFAVENDAVWVYTDDGQRVAVPNEEATV